MVALSGDFGAEVWEEENASGMWMRAAHAIARITALEAAVRTAITTLESVNSHRLKDDDGNHVAWVGESTFIQVGTAIAICRSVLGEVRQM